MLIDNLKSVVEANKKEVSDLFLRNLLKEKLQYYVLDYIYSSSWGENLLFKGGTCLRFCFDLSRLSEDLDLDIKDEKKFDLDQFLTDIKNYFSKTLQYKDLDLYFSGNKQQIKLKFPIMESLNLKQNRSESNILFLRLDIQEIDSDIYNEEVSLISTYDFNFIIKRYSLPDLFASKIAAILTRSFKKGDKNKITFKGRDYYDLIWFLEKGISPNYKRLEDITGDNKKTVIKKLDDKVEKVDKKYLIDDLSPLFRKKGFVKDFAENFKDLYQSNKDKFL